MAENRRTSALALRGIVPPICTPLDEGGAVDVPSLERLAARLLDAGVSGLFVLGSTGEAAYLDDAQRRRAVDTVLGVASRSVPVIVGALDTTPNRVIGQVRALQRDDIAGWVVTAPFYANVSDDEMARHFELVASGTDLPVYAYDIPGNTNRKIPVEVSQDLLERGVVAGVKDSSGALDDFDRLLERLGSSRAGAVLTGSDTAALRALEAGADGIVPGLANVFAELFVVLYDAFMRGESAEASAAQKEIATMSGLFSIGQRHGLARHASELGALKHVLHARGVIATPLLAAPLSAYPPEAAAELEALVGTGARP